MLVNWEDDLFTRIYNIQTCIKMQSMQVIIKGCGNLSFYAEIICATS